MPILFRGIFIWGVIGALLTLIYQLSGTQLIEFDQLRITTCKEVHGWERKKEYKVEDCTEFQWDEGAEGQRQGLKCKVGWKTVMICEGLSEDETTAILVALQKYLPDVAQRICSQPSDKEHFLTLGLGGSN